MSDQKYLSNFFPKGVRLGVRLPALLRCLLASLEQVEDGEASVSSPAMTLSSAIENTDKVPVVKAKATHVIMNSLITSKHPILSEWNRGRKSLGGSANTLALACPDCVAHVRLKPHRGGGLA